MANNAALDLMKNIHSITMPGFKYIGSFTSLPKKANIGDLCKMSGAYYFYSDNKWIDVGDATTQPYYPTTITVEKMKPRLCTQCGAPLHNNKCEFCDTEYC